LTRYLGREAFWTTVHIATENMDCLLINVLSRMPELAKQGKKQKAKR